MNYENALLRTTAEVNALTHTTALYELLMDNPSEIWRFYHFVMSELMYLAKMMGYRIEDGKMYKGDEILNCGNVIDAAIQKINRKTEFSVN